jgi:hypothetical protein
VIAGPEGFVGVIVYMTCGILGMPVQERDTPTTLPMLSSRLYAFRLVGIGVCKAKPVVSREVVARIVLAGEVPKDRPSLFTPTMLMI